MKKIKLKRVNHGGRGISPGLGRWAAFATLLTVIAGPVPAQDRRPSAIGSGMPAAIEMEEYRLSPGDAVSVTFPYNAELNYEGTIGPDGRLTLPLIGALPLAGRTSGAAEAQIADALRRARIVADARPSLAIRTYGASVFVGGEVRTPGAVRLTGPMDAMRAVILAGGALDTAKTKKVVVIRQLPDGTATLRYVDLRAYVKSGGVGEDASLRAYDVVFVPRSSIAEANLWIDQHINRLLPFSRSLNYNVGDIGARTAIGN